MENGLLTAKHLKDENAARKYLEAICWPNGPICPHCSATKIYRLKVKNTQREVLKCAGCRKQFTVTVGTIFEDSHLPLTLWLQAFQLFCSSKKGMSAHQLHRMLGITYKSAWFMSHRIRHAVAEPMPQDKLGGRGSQYTVVEVDETYIGGKRRQVKHGSRSHKTPVVALVERDGRVRSRVMKIVNAKNIKDMIRENVKKDSYIITDSFSGYRGLDKDFNYHEMVNHYAKEYVRGQIHTNTVEGFFSLLKRGLTGTFHHVSRQHLPRYLAEFDFRYNERKVTDLERSMAALKIVEGKRLQYRSASQQAGH